MIVKIWKNDNFLARLNLEVLFTQEIMMTTIKKKCAVLGLGLTIFFAGCDASNSNQTTGILLGGATGALLGSTIGNGDGKSAAIGIGAVLGALVGSQIGAKMDQNDRAMAQDAADKAAYAPVGQEITWSNSQSGHRGSAKSVQSGVDSQGHTCRKIEQQVTVEGKTDLIVVDVCMIDNHWVVVS